MRTIILIFLAVMGTAFTPPDESIEDFESQGFQQYSWEMTGPVFWSITTQVPYQGGFSAVSGNIGALQNTAINLSLNVSEPGTISFARKVSSENGFDFLRFYIDGVEQSRWSGNVSWGVVTFNVPTGTHQFSWSYQKDGSGTAGSDCAWLDHIVLPPHQIAVATVLQIKEENTIQPIAYPNPTPQHTNIRLHLDNPDTIQVELTDGRGCLQQILVLLTYFGSGTHLIPIDLGSIPDGLYYVVIRNRAGIKLLTIMKQRN